MASWRSFIDDSSPKISRSLPSFALECSLQKRLVSCRRPVFVCLDQSNFLSFFMCWLSDTASLGCFDLLSLSIGIQASSSFNLLMLPTFP